MICHDGDHRSARLRLSERQQLVPPGLAVMGSKRIEPHAGGAEAKTGRPNWKNKATRRRYSARLER